jgi:hypothetical protein
VPGGVGRLSATAPRPLAVVPGVAERIAALLDGRLDGARRAATLDGLDRARAALETLADSAAVVRELERARRADPTRALHAWATRQR